jgi:hypothetical protein
MPKRDREKCVVILGLLALALPGMAHAAPRPASPHGLARVFAPAVGDPQVLSLPPSVWPAGAPSLINRAITAADADVESAFRVGTVFHRRTYAAGGMQGGFYQVDTGARNTAWLGSF